MPDFTKTTDSKLVRLYKGKSKMVAFLDESYLSKPSPGVPFFFAMTAVVISSGNIDSVRWAYADKAGHAKWHTTEKFRDGYIAEIEGFVDLLVSEADPVLLVVQIDAELNQNDLEAARRTCFMKLVEILHEIHEVRLVVYERRRPGHEQDNDEETAKALRTSHEMLSVVDAWSGSEPLLWGPDIVAWTMQRRLLRGEGWFDPLIDVATVYRHDGTLVADMKKRALK